jgi:serine O-acetyltransferase
MLWDAVLEEGKSALDNDKFMEPILNTFILNHSSFSSAIAFSLAKYFSGIISMEKWHEIFIFPHATSTKYEENMDNLENMGLLDLQALSNRDPASEGLINPFLNFKGFKSLQAHRVAHILWKNGRKDTARAIQARCSELWGVDIHPAAVIGQFNLMPL